LDKRRKDGGEHGSKHGNGVKKRLETTEGCRECRKALMILYRQRNMLEQPEEEEEEKRRERSHQFSG